MNRRTLIYLTFLLIAIFLSGCTSPNAASSRIKAFSDATGLVTSNMKEALDTTDRKYFEVQVQRAVVNYDRHGFQPENFQPLFPPPERQLRDAVLDSFALYGQKLSTMMGNEQLDEFDEATKDFGNKLESLSKSIGNTKTFTAANRPLNESEIQMLTTAIQGIGSLFIQWKRERSVSELVTLMDTNVQVVCEALTADLHVLSKVLTNEFNQGRMAQDQFILHSNLDPIAKRTEIRTLAQSVLDERNAEATFIAMEQTIANWRTAHARLLQVFSKDKTQIDGLIQQLTADGMRIKAFYDSPQNSKKP